MQEYEASVAWMDCVSSVDWMDCVSSVDWVDDWDFLAFKHMV